jgi:hypothetical protein
VDSEIGRVDDEIGHGADGVELVALFGDAFADRPVARERVRTPGLAEPADESGVARLQKDEHRFQTCGRPQTSEHARKLRQEALLAHIDDNGEFIERGALPSRQFRHGRNQLRRQVVDAEVAEVLERANRVCLSGT